MKRSTAPRRCVSWSWPPATQSRAQANPGARAVRCRQLRQPAPVGHCRRRHARCRSAWWPSATCSAPHAPLYLYGYGAYGESLDPWFSHARLSLLERGFVSSPSPMSAAAASWAKPGTAPASLQHKQNSFERLYRLRRTPDQPRTVTPSAAAAGDQRRQRRRAMLIGACAQPASQSCSPRPSPRCRLSMCSTPCRTPTCR